MNIIIQLLKYFLLLLVALVATGAIYQWRAAAADKDQFPPPGKLYAVDGLNLHLDCRGEGTPTVILEAGLTSGSSSWGLVHDTLAELTRICAYDRPGMDWSDETDAPIDAATVAERLSKLLALAEIDGPQILLGMSAGGVFVREYYARYPQSVVGMVLVDSSHEQQGNRLPVIGDTSQLSTLLSLCSWLQPVGVVRAFGLLDALQARYQLPDTMRALVSANSNQSHTCKAMLLESEGFNREIYDSQPPNSLNDLPLTVLSQGKTPEADNEFGLSLADARNMAVIWDGLQQELTELSTVGQRRIATESGHVIQLEQPQMVIDAVRDMVVQTRQVLAVAP